MSSQPPMALLRELTPAMASEVIRINSSNQFATGWGVRQKVVTFVRNGRRIVVVRDKIFTLDLSIHPHDFLAQFQKETLGTDWGQSELAKPYSDRHPLLQWHEDQANHWKRERTRLGAAGTIGIQPTGRMKALYACAYDLFTTANNNLLDTKLLERLRTKDQFQGARYELFVRAFMLKAGFAVELEDENDRKKTHVEFYATSNRSRRRFGVEAKSRGRAGLLGKPGEPQSIDEIQLDFGSLLSEALAKECTEKRIVFLDLNFPPSEVEETVPWWHERMTRIIEKKEFQRLPDGSKLPPCYLVLTNHPYHFGDLVTSAPMGRMITTGFNIPGYRGIGLQEQLAQHPIVGELVSGWAYLDFPSTFPDI